MKRFLEACRAPGPLELLVERPGVPGTVRHVLHQPFAVLGRDPLADVVLDDPTVSQRHVYLQVIGGAVYCADLDTRTGTHWPDGPRRGGWVGVDDPLGLGPFRVRVASAGRGPLPLESPLARGEMNVDAFPAVTLELPSRVTSRLRLNRVLTLIGRSPRCKLQLEGQEISRYHCSIVLTPAGSWAIDLASREGIRIGGQPVRCHPLADDDRLEVKPFSLRVRCEPVPLAGEPAVLLPECRAVSAESWGRQNVSAVVLRAAGEGDNGRAAPDGGEAPRPSADPTRWANQLDLAAGSRFEDFRELLWMMFQMMGELHREHMNEVLTELRLLRESTQELAQVRAQLPAPEPAAEARETPAAVRKEAPTTATASPRPVAAAEAKGGENGPASPEAVHAWLCDRIASLEAERQGHWQKLMGFLARKQG